MMNHMTLHRRSIRLKGYDYAQGGTYFITIDTKRQQSVFGEVVDGEMKLNRAGEIVSEEWLKTPDIRPDVWLDYFVVMPNHFHAIIMMLRNVGATRRVARAFAEPMQYKNGPASGSIGAMIGQFKSATTKRINAWRGTPGVPIWHRNYYERIIRKNGELNRVREYIAANPAQWANVQRPPLTPGKVGATRRVAPLPQNAR